MHFSAQCRYNDVLCLTSGSSDEVIREMISVRKDVEALSQPLSIVFTRLPPDAVLLHRYRERLKMNIRLLDSPVLVSCLL